MDLFSVLYQKRIGSKLDNVKFLETYRVSDPGLNRLDLKTRHSRWGFNLQCSDIEYVFAICLGGVKHESIRKWKLRHHR